MAVALTELDAYVSQKIAPEAVDVVYASDPMLVRLESGRRQDFTGNTRVKQVVTIGKLAGGFLGRGEEMDVKFVTTEAAITTDMKVAWVNITLYGYDAMNDDGDEAMFNQVELKFLNASLRMAELLATNMYLNGQGSRIKYLNGFDEWYDDGNNYPTVGGQTRNDIMTTGTVGGLNAYQATLTTFTMAQLNTAYGNATWGADHVDIIPVTQNAWNLIWQGTQPQMRYANSDNDLANVGFQNFKFNGADVVISRYLPTGSSGMIFGFNTQYIDWWMSRVPMFQFGWTGFKPLSAKSLDSAGQYCLGSNLLVKSPRTGFKLKSALF